jgi:hypothetical protein
VAGKIDGHGVGLTMVERCNDALAWGHEMILKLEEVLQYSKVTLLRQPFQLSLSPDD